tara:strand:- start:336 stop:635 length:300 start_codon:yes stop_codon:yes gene_type:complete
MPARKTAAKVEAPHKHAELEKKIASLEALIVGLKKEFAAHCVKSEEEHKRLEGTCHACCEEVKRLGAKVEEPQEGGVDALSKKVDNLAKRLERAIPRRR